MSLENYKITQQDIETKGVVAAPNILSGSAEKNKAIFDRLIREAVAVQFNALIDELKESGVEMILRRGDENVKFLRVGSSGILEVSADGETYTPTVSAGHNIEDGDANKLPTRGTLRFLNSRISVEDQTIVIDPNGKDGENGEDGKSAYEGAQEAGYKGTEEEFYADLSAVGNKADVSPVVEISLPAEAWTEVDVGYKQTVAITGGTENTLVSLQTSPGQVVLLMEAGVTALMVNNDGGIFHAYAVGGKPDSDMAVQATLEEVAQ